MHGGSGPLRCHGHVQHGNGGRVVTTQQGVLALLTTVTMRATSKSENASEEFLSLESIAIHLSTILPIYSLYPLVHVSISH